MDTDTAISGTRSGVWAVALTAVPSTGSATPPLPWSASFSSASPSLWNPLNSRYLSLSLSHRSASFSPMRFRKEDLISLFMVICWWLIDSLYVYVKWRLYEAYGVLFCLLVLCVPFRCKPCDKWCGFVWIQYFFRMVSTIFSDVIVCFNWFSIMLPQVCNVWVVVINSGK